MVYKNINFKVKCLPRDFFNIKPYYLPVSNYLDIWDLIFTIWTKERETTFSSALENVCAFNTVCKFYEKDSSNVFTYPWSFLDESVNIDVTMTYSNQFNDSLLDPESSYYKQFSKQATNDFTTIIKSTLTLTVGDDTLVWSFSKGSTVATSQNVSVMGTNDVSDAQLQISSANVPSDITKITVQGMFFQF